MSKISFNQSGYVGSSMSVHAAEAYEDGQMPKSKWTKQRMLQAIASYVNENDLTLTEDQVRAISKLKKEDLFHYFFEFAGWHHTSKFCKETDFYQLDEWWIEAAIENELSFAKYWEMEVCVGNQFSQRNYQTKEEVAKAVEAMGFEFSDLAWGACFKQQVFCRGEIEIRIREKIN